MLRVTIKDKDALQLITVDSFKEYLSAKGWYFKEDYLRTMVSGQRIKIAEIWSMDTGIVSQTAIVVPNSESMVDYAARMSENLIILEKIENRSQLQIYVDLSKTDLIIKQTKKTKT